MGPVRPCRLVVRTYETLANLGSCLKPYRYGMPTEVANPQGTQMLRRDWNRSEYDNYVARLHGSRSLAKGLLWEGRYEFQLLLLPRAVGGLRIEMRLVLVALLSAPCSYAKKSQTAQIGHQIHKPDPGC